MGIIIAEVKMKKEITTKDLMALNELMTFENWIAVKMQFCSENVQTSSLKKIFATMANEHCQNHEKLLKYLEVNAGEGDK